MTGSINLTAAQAAAVSDLDYSTLRGLTLTPILSTGNGSGYYDVQVTARYAAEVDILVNHFYVTRDGDVLTGNEYAERIIAEDAATQ